MIYIRLAEITHLPIPGSILRRQRVGLGHSSDEWWMRERESSYKGEMRNSENYILKLIAHQPSERETDSCTKLADEA